MTPHITNPLVWIPMLLLFIWGFLLILVFAVSFVGSQLLWNDPVRHQKFREVMDKWVSWLCFKRPA